MFQNSSQGGSFFELFDAKNIKERQRPIFKVSNSNNMSRQFDKTLKGYTLDLMGTSNKVTFPRQQKQDLYLVQQYLVLQLFIQPNSCFTLELIITDVTKTKRRVVFTHTVSKPQKKPFFVKVDSDHFCKARWLNLCIDLHSFMRAFKGQTYRSLDQIYLSGSFRLKKIYTTQSALIDIEDDGDTSYDKSTTLQENVQNSLPKHFSFPPGVPFTTQTFCYTDYFPDDQASEAEEEIQEFKATDISSNISNVHSNQRFKDTRKEFSTPKVEPLKSSNNLNDNTGYRKFLANTNSTQMVMRNRKVEQSNLEKKLINKPTNKSVNKYTGTQQKPRELPIQPKSTLTATSKTNSQMSKTRNTNTSIEKKTSLIVRSPKRRNERLEVTKLNPWKAQGHRRHEQESYVKEQIQVDDDRDIKSANTTIFKKKGNHNQNKIKLGDPKFNTNARIDANTYSDSEYFEMSQKFSTITDPKFFKPEVITKMSQNMHESKQPTRRQQEEEIEEAIEIDLTSVHQSNRNQTAEITDRKSNHPNIDLEESADQKETTHRDGFMDQHLRRMMDEIERPYTPPINSHDTDKLEKKPSNESRQIELIYDQILNCYYDFKTNIYYELKP